MQNGIVDLPDHLQTLKTRIITNEACRAGEPVYHDYIYGSVMCTLTHEGQGICYGDSGGSLVVDNYIVGIPSWLASCAVGFPDAYARVSSYADWIYTQMNTTVQNNQWNYAQ